MPRVVPEYKQEAKTRIVDAANQVFGENGYRQATMEDVAKKLGVSKGALYLYFSSKEKLFEEMCRREPLALKEILYSTFKEGNDPLESASDFFDIMTKRYRSNPGLSFEIFSEASRNPELKRILKKTQEEYVQTLDGFLEEIRKRGYLPKNTDLRPLNYASIALWNGIETLMISGLPMAEAKQAWLEGFKALFLNTPNNKILPHS